MISTKFSKKNQKKKQRVPAILETLYWIKARLWKLIPNFDAFWSATQKSECEAESVSEQTCIMPLNPKPNVSGYKEYKLNTQRNTEISLIATRATQVMGQLLAALFRHLVQTMLLATIHNRPSWILYIITLTDCMTESQWYCSIFNKLLRVVSVITNLYCPAKVSSPSSSSNY